jgi:hypothetical protein
MNMVAPRWIVPLRSEAVFSKDEPLIAEPEMQYSRDGALSLALLTRGGEASIALLPGIVV